MKARALVTILLLGVGLVALAGFGSSAASRAAPSSAGDAAITAAIQALLDGNGGPASPLVQSAAVETLDGVVYLTGIVETEDARREAGRLLRHAAGVEGVVSFLTVRERVVGTWIDDEMIGSRVRSKLLARPGIRAGEIDSSSSQGIVTLIGRVGSTAIRDEVEGIARATPGVKDVRNHLLVGRTRS